MIGSHPLLQVYRIIKELRVALPLSHHDGNTLLAHLPQLGYFFLSSQADLGNTPYKHLTFALSSFDSRAQTRKFFELVHSNGFNSPSSHRKKAKEWNAGE